ncbi:MAG: hypothetical protein Q7L55_00035 [Actinomycetota bacterium]|nr:hypothetical protein [Actinomycetota bacterium]
MAVLVVAFAAVVFFLVVYETALTLAVDEIAVDAFAADDVADVAAAAASDAFVAASRVLVAMRPPTPKNIPAARPPEMNRCFTDVGRRALLLAPREFMCPRFRHEGLREIIHGLGAG